MVKHFLLLLIAIGAGTVRAAEPDFRAIGHKLVTDGGTSTCGTDDSTGLWVVAIGRADVTDGEAKARAAAELEARKELASFFTVQVQSVTESAYSESDAGIQEAFSQMARQDVSELLRGVRIESCRVEEGVATAIAVLTQKTADASAALKRAMADERPGTVTASGEGPTADAALEAAKRNALEQVMGSSIVGSDSSQDGSVRSRVYSDVQGMVSAYRILEQTQEGNVCRVRIVAEVDKDELQESYGAQMKAVGDPIFWITGTNDDAIRQISDFLMGKGLKCAVQKGTADYKVETKTEFNRVKHPVNGRPGSQLQLTVICYDKSGVQLFTLQNDPRKSSTFTGTEERQAQICVEKAVKQIGKPLHERLQRAIADMTNNGRTVRMVFRNLRTAAQAKVVESITDTINESIPSAGSATFSRNDEVASATIRLTLKGNSQDFLTQLRQSCPDLPAASSVTPNKIIFELP